jgi:hypothetical protein
MTAAALIVSLVALALSGWSSIRQLGLARHANSLPTLVELFKEHRTNELADARHFVCSRLPSIDVSDGLAALDESDQQLVRALGWYYDNLGVLVAHGVVPVAPVAGYLGGSLIECWERMEPLVQAERAKRAQMTDPTRWQEYFENLYLLVEKETPAKARSSAPLWRKKVGGLASAPKPSAALPNAPSEPTEPEQDV